MQSLLREGWIVREDWSRRRFLHTTLVSAVLPGALVVTDTATGGIPVDKAAAAIRHPLTVVSVEMAAEAPDAGTTSVLSGDRLARLSKMHLHLRRDRPSQVALYLDETDRLLWELALDDAQVTATLRGDSGMQLEYRKVRT